MKRILLPLLVILVVFTALKLIDGLRAERGARRDEVVETITRTAGGALEVVTPLLVTELTETYPMTSTRTREVVRQGVVVKEDYTVEYVATELRRVQLIPSEVEAAATSHVETRFIGIFPGRVQAAQVHLAGKFLVPSRLLAPQHAGGHTRLTAARLDFSLLSLRSLEQITLATWQQHALHFEPSTTGLQGYETALAQLPLADVTLDQPTPFELNLALRGGHSFSVHPLGEKISVKLDSDWPHADFTLRARTTSLPTQRTITETSTHGEWLMSGLSSGLKAAYDLNDPNETRLFAHGLEAVVGADFVEPVDVFARLERSVKYGVLLIGLSLSLLWLMVVRSKARAHLMHYTLIALNLAIFFLLLLSLAEKVDFLIAYAVSATAVTALNVVYLSGLLGSLRKAVLAAIPSAVSFAALYSLLISEDQALLLGSLFVFAVLAGLMLFTRKLDWHGVLAARGA